MIRSNFASRNSLKIRSTESMLVSYISMYIYIYVYSYDE